jgi:glutathione S-transferase
MALTLYHVHWCPECAVVREKLAELKLQYEDIIVPDVRTFRKQVYEVSGQYYVPVLKDGDLVLTETHDILSHLDERARAGASGSQAVRATADHSHSNAGVLTDADHYPSCRISPKK